MTDYTELQKAAEYAAQDAIKFADEDEEMRALQQFHEEVDPETVLALIAENERLEERNVYWIDQANTIARDRNAIRSERDQLKAESERLVPFEEAYATACNVRNRLIKENELLDRLVVTNKAISDSFRDERDQLRAEVAGLRTGYEAYERVNAELKAENERLRKECDARHPFKPFHEPAIGFTGCVICGVYTDHGGLPCPKTRATADAAMGKGEKS